MLLNGPAVEQLFELEEREKKRKERETAAALEAAQERESYRIEVNENGNEKDKAFMVSNNGPITTKYSYELCTEAKLVEQHNENSLQSRNAEGDRDMNNKKSNLIGSSKKADLCLNDSSPQIVGRINTCTIPSREEIGQSNNGAQKNTIDCEDNSPPDLAEERPSSCCDESRSKVRPLQTYLSPNNNQRAKFQGMSW